MKDGTTKDWYQEELEQKALRERVIARRNADKRRHDTSKTSARLNSSQKKPKVISNFSLNKLPSVPRPTRKQISYIVLFFAVIIFATLMQSRYTQLGIGKTPKLSSELIESAKKPEFNTILPAGQQSQTESGKIGYDAAKKVASFTDKIGDVPITVSQQPLPESFKENPDDELKKLADGFSATKVIAVATSKAYLGTSANGPQTVIFQKQGLLIFISSTNKIDESEWAKYINGLR